MNSQIIVNHSILSRVELCKYSMEYELSKLECKN